MKYAPLIVALAIAIIALGCGGSSGGGSTTGTGTTTTGATTGDPVTTQIIAESAPGVQVDPTNAQVGDTLTFKLVLIDLATGTYTTLPHAAFTTTDTKGVAGTLNTLTGAFVARASTAGVSFTISTTAQSVTYNAAYAVTPVQGRVSGTVIDSNGVAVPFAVVLFFDSSSNQVGMTTATVNGAFNGSVSMLGTRFNLSSASLNPSHYYEAFTYGSGSYGPLIKTCSAPLPALISGRSVSLSGPVVVASVSDASGVQNTPPPPPTCSP
ncbi:MAG: hypothetical protein ACYC96_06115 [Fimbriimonadaceae bacterium]